MYKTKLSEIMTTDLVTVIGDTTMDKVENIFKANGFHHLPVVNNAGKLIGILSKGDYQLVCDKMTVFTQKQDVRFLQSILVSEMMTRFVAKLKPTDSVEMAADLFKENLFHAIPIVDEENVLKGMVTTFDLINYAFSNPPEYIIAPKQGGVTVTN